MSSKLSVEVSSGSPLSGNYELQSNTGRVNLTLPKDSDLAIKAESRTGRYPYRDSPVLAGKTGRSTSIVSLWDRARERLTCELAQAQSK